MTGGKEREDVYVGSEEGEEEEDGGEFWPIGFENGDGFVFHNKINLWLY